MYQRKIKFCLLTGVCFGGFWRSVIVLGSISLFGRLRNALLAIFSPCGIPPGSSSPHNLKSMQASRSHDAWVVAKVLKLLPQWYHPRLGISKGGHLFLWSLVQWPENRFLLAVGAPSLLHNGSVLCISHPSGGAGGEPSWADFLSWVVSVTIAREVTGQSKLC